MGFCAIVTCRKSSKHEKKSSGITFHQFPREPKLKFAWTEQIGRSDDWIPRKYSYVCSSHFTPDCFLETKHKLRRLRPNSIPTLLLPPWVKLNASQFSNGASMPVRCSSETTHISETVSTVTDDSVLDDGFYEIELDDTPKERKLKIELKKTRRDLEAEKLRCQERLKCIKKLRQTIRRNQIKLQSMKQLFENKTIEENKLNVLKDTKQVSKLISRQVAKSKNKIPEETLIKTLHIPREYEFISCDAKPDIASEAFMALTPKSENTEH